MDIKKFVNLWIVFLDLKPELTNQGSLRPRAAINPESEKVLFLSWILWELKMRKREKFFWFLLESLKESSLFQTSIVHEHFLNNKERIHLALNPGSKPHPPYSNVLQTWKRTSFVKCITKGLFGGPKSLGVIAESIERAGQRGRL
ncbi:MAG: hypothetical protein OXF73_00840 [Gammaproteobacteria bacterium]|nr:hypothetical protein [Gammaproteobacteria bacterium]